MPKRTPRQTLKKAISLAIEHGWDRSNLHLFIFKFYTTDELLQFNRYFMIIFDHDFAKALWGEDDKDYGRTFMPNGSLKVTRYYGKPKWQYHLQQMVTAEDSIAYLHKNI